MKKQQQDRQDFESIGELSSEVEVRREERLAALEDYADMTHRALEESGAEKLFSAFSDHAEHPGVSGYPIVDPQAMETYSQEPKISETVESQRSQNETPSLDGVSDAVGSASVTIALAAALGVDGVRSLMDRQDDNAPTTDAVESQSERGSTDLDWSYPSSPVEHGPDSNLDWAIPSPSAEPGHDPEQDGSFNPDSVFSASSAEHGLNSQLDWSFSSPLAEPGHDPEQDWSVPGNEYMSVEGGDAYLSEIAPEQIENEWGDDIAIESESGGIDSAINEDSDPVIDSGHSESSVEASGDGGGGGE